MTASLTPRYIRECDNWFAVMEETWIKSKLWQYTLYLEYSQIKLHLKLIEMYHTSPVYLRICENSVQYSTVQPVCGVQTARILYTIPRQRSQWQHAAQITLTWSQRVRPVSLSSAKVNYFMWTENVKLTKLWAGKRSGIVKKVSLYEPLCCDWVPASTRPQSDSRHRYGDTSQTIIICNKTSHLLRVGEYQDGTEMSQGLFNLRDDSLLCNCCCVVCEIEIIIMS